ncbi:MAG: M23 family metallopeptidase [Deltaproteobacteria bacterium]|nr:MAG: M23 family metallopeptidase [Deltaproteobacteria bacterium]
MPARHEAVPVAPLLRPVEEIDGRRTPIPDRIEVDEALLRTAAVLDSLRAASDPLRRQPAPRAVVREWEALLLRLDEYLDQPPAQTPAVELVRAKLMVEGQLKADVETWRLPGGLTDRIRSRIAYLGHRIEQARRRMRPLPRTKERLHFVWPVDPVIVNSGFGRRLDPIRRNRHAFHYGVDLEAYLGQVVSAAGPGVVTWAGWNGGHGRQVEITHPGGWVTRYSHLSHILVRRGDRLASGDPVGLAGSTGRSTGPHLHFEVWLHGHVKDPLEVLGDPVLMAMEQDHPAAGGGN